ncbi:unnamed protein product [Zymoseptoria tritici ST99CH_1E4]|uniref:Uncharacterized protein n=1 Tax=Zymoseptoria tritici ST99CH_1E4 TaxID=1276532 RepID=A0A2H1GT58_ZYMTR|nr:unnamed protein product [Zymoseptoria tritici ST99CH_1E4]
MFWCSHSCVSHCTKACPYFASHTTIHSYRQASRHQLPSLCDPQSTSPGPSGAMASVRLDFDSGDDDDREEDSPLPAAPPKNTGKRLGHAIEDNQVRDKKLAER